MKKIVINGFFRIAMFTAIAALTACGGGGGGGDAGGDKPPGGDNSKTITASSSSGLALSAPGSSTAKLSGALGGAKSTRLTFTAATAVKKAVTVTIAGDDASVATLSAANCSIPVGTTSCNVTLTAVKDGSVTLSYQADNDYTVSPSSQTFKISSGSIKPDSGGGDTGDWTYTGDANPAGWKGGNLGMCTGSSIKDILNVNCKYDGGTPPQSACLAASSDSLPQGLVFNSAKIPLCWKVYMPETGNSIMLRVIGYNDAHTKFEIDNPGWFSLCPYTDKTNDKCYNSQSDARCVNCQVTGNDNWSNSRKVKAKIVPCPKDGAYKDISFADGSC